jgi:hypothetical protein
MMTIIISQPLDATMRSTLQLITFSSVIRCAQCLGLLIYRLHSSWTDHQLHSFLINLSQTLIGLGFWRANLILAQQKAYRVQLKQRLSCTTSSLPSQMTAQEQWDYVKSEIRLFTQRYAIDYTNRYKKSIKALQCKHNAFLRSQPPTIIRLHLFFVIDQQT